MDKWVIFKSSAHVLDNIFWIFVRSVNTSSSGKVCVLTPHSAGQMDFLTFFESQLGWPTSTNTWEPMEHLNCEELIKEFEQKQKPGEYTSILLGFF